MKNKASTPKAAPEKLKTAPLYPGQAVTWPVRAQGADREAEGTVIALMPAGSSPHDVWPRGLPKPTARELVGFKKTREHAHVIVEEKIDGKRYYRTPRLTAPVLPQK